MKNLKTTILTAFIAICCLTNGIAQENKLKASDGKKGHKKVVLSLGGGTSMPSSDGKDKAFLSNSTAINADLFLPLIRKGWDGGGARDHVKGHKMYFGLNVGGTYNFGGSGNFGTLPNAYAVTGQTSNTVSPRGGAPADPGFRMGAGPQANFYFGKFIVSPMVLGEYFSMTQKKMSIVQTTEYNGQSYDFNLATLPETKTSGFAVTPKLRLHYMFNDRFGLFADASYTTGPKVETIVSQLIPNGNPSPQSGSYTLQQLQTGTMVKGETKSTAYSAMGFNFGVVIGLGGNSHGDNLTNGIVKPACTCCGSKVHDRIDCPDITRCNTQTASSQVALSDDLHKAQGDIKKGWDGTVKGLFVGKNLDILVAKNGGVEKFIEQINKVGKGKASLIKIKNIDFIKIESTVDNIEQYSFYEIKDSGSNPLGKIIASGGVICKLNGCPDCKLKPSYGNSEKCFCESGAEACLEGGIALPIPDYVSGMDHSTLALPISTDNTGQLTATSIKDLKNLMLQTFPKAAVIKSEIIKEGKDKFIKVDLNENGNVFSVVNMVNNPNHTWILLACTGNCNGSITDCTSKNPNLLGACNCPGDNHCFGVNGIVFGLTSDIQLQN